MNISDCLEYNTLALKYSRFNEFLPFSLSAGNNIGIAGRGSQRHSPELGRDDMILNSKLS
jgi:hypothetical protein